MRPSPKHLFGRAAAKARQSAAGSPTPAGVEPPAPTTTPPPPPPPRAETEGKQEPEGKQAGEHKQDPQPEQQPDGARETQQVPHATARERVAMRRRIRRLRRTREVLLRELGALVVEMNRQDRENPKLLKVKGAEVAALDRELRGLQAALAQGQTIEQVVAAGVAGRCSTCATLIAIDDRFCPNCGTPARPPQPKAEAPAGDQEAPALSAAGTSKE
jgi:hypothetical protein